MPQAVLQTNIAEYPLFARGKVRDVYDLGDRLLIVATDRISAFDWVLPSAIPGKGVILNAMSLFWFTFMRDIVSNHVLASEIKDYPTSLQKYENELAGRSMIVKKAKRIDIECVARGYLVGSGYKDYTAMLKANPDIHAINLYGTMISPRLRMADRLPYPIFTPATKADTGHDENISFEKLSEMVGGDLAAKLRDMTLAIYSKALDYAVRRGIIIADTKFEFGFIDGELSLIDEILSPDSSRFWPVESYAPGKNPPSFDKQFLRDWLESSGWDKNSPPPELPDDVVEKTLEKYRQAHRILVGHDVV